MDITKLDPESRRQLEIIELRTAQEKLNKELKELDEATDKIWSTVSDHESMLDVLRNRIKVLEDARGRQILFNTEVTNKLKPVPPSITLSPTPKEGVKNIWSFWK